MGRSPPQTRVQVSVVGLSCYTFGRADRFVTDRNWAIVERLEAWAGEHGRSLLEIAFGWLLARPSVSSVIAGATKPEQAVANAAAAAVQLSAEEVTEISELAQE